MNNSKSFEQIIQPITGYLKRVDEITAQKLATGVPLIDGASLHLIAAGGKRIRAALIILSSGLKGGDPGISLDIAAAAEIVHTATLIHDDIIDQSIMRRGIATVQQVWDSRVSVLAGDFMYTVSLDIAVETGNPAIFPVIVSATRDMVKGELYQLQYSNPESINFDHYMKIIELKTARFMAGCARLGGLIAGFSAEECDALYRFGLNLGYGFQIIDDTLDLIDNSAVTGKDSGNDLLEGKITLPVIYYMEGLSSSDREGFVSAMKNLTRETIKPVLASIAGSGAIDRARIRAEEFILNGTLALEGFPPSAFKRVLEEISEFIIYRNY